MKMKNKITVLLTTCDRYETTLPLCLMSIFNQSRKPDRIVLVDDSPKKKFYDFQTLRSMITLFGNKGICFDYYHGSCKGQTHALQLGIEKILDGWVLKMDDDNVLEHDVIELFEKNIKKNVGAISGVFIDKRSQHLSEDSKKESFIPKNGYYNCIEDVFSYVNIQLIHKQSKNIKKVQHLHSLYFFRRDLIGEYCLELAPSSMREDTIMTHEMFMKGYDLLVIPSAVIHHLVYDQNSGNRKWAEQHIKKNTFFFISKIKEWGVIPDKLQLYENDEFYFVKKDEKEFLVTKK